MPFELPFMKAVQRQARPRVVFSRLNPAHNLGITAGGLQPNTSNNAVKGLGIKPNRMACGGPVYMADGGNVPDMGSYDPGSAVDAVMSSFAPSAHSLSAPNSYDYQQMDPNSQASYQSNDGSTGVNPDGSLTYDAHVSHGASGDPGHLTGLGGWLQAKHAGIPGSNWLKAGLTAMTGVLGGLASRGANQKSINTPQFQKGLGGFGNPGVLGGFSRGGAVRMSVGGTTPEQDPEIANQERLMVAASGADQYAAEPWYKQLIDTTNHINFSQMPGTSYEDKQQYAHQMMQKAAQASWSRRLATREQDEPSGQMVGNFLINPKMAAGGPVPQQQPQGGPQQPEDTQNKVIAMQAVQALMGQSQNPQAAIQAFVQHFGQAALQQLQAQVQQTKGGPQQGGPQQLSGGGQPSNLIGGPGDGMSDNVPMGAPGGQRAQLSNGEYVVPADAVSQLGNGSTEAGARKLDSGIASLRHAKYGHSRQPKKLPPNSNPILGQQ